MVGPSGDACRDAVDEVVEVKRRELVSAWPQVHQVAVAQPERGDAQLLLQRQVTEPLQHPAVVIKPGIG